MLTSLNPPTATSILRGLEEGGRPQAALLLRAAVIVLIGLLIVFITFGAIVALVYRSRGSSFSYFEGAMRERNEKAEWRSRGDGLTRCSGVFRASQFCELTLRSPIAQSPLRPGAPTAQLARRAIMPRG
jgi:hypothetical protein